MTRRVCMMDIHLQDWLSVGSADPPVVSMDARLTALFRQETKGKDRNTTKDDVLAVLFHVCTSFGERDERHGGLPEPDVS